MLRADRGGDVALKLERLLETFTHPDGSPWCGSEIERATNKVVSQSYFSALRKGRIRRPGAEQLRAIAEVMGFPLELWHSDFEQWPSIIERRTYGASSSADGAGSRSIRQSFRTIWRTVPNPQTQAPYTYEEISDRAGGEISPEEIRQIADGENENPDYYTIVALSELFNVSTDYWHAETVDSDRILDAEILEALGENEGREVLRRWSRLSARPRSMLLNVLENLEELEADGPAPSSA